MKAWHATIAILVCGSLAFGGRWTNSGAHRGSGRIGLRRDRDGHLPGACGLGRRSGDGGAVRRSLRGGDTPMAALVRAAVPWW